MSASYVALAVELPDMEDIYPILESESRAARQSAFLEFLSEQFDADYEEDLVIDDISLEGAWLVVDFQCSTELCNEITHTLFECLAEKDGQKMTALEYNSRIGVYTVMVPGYDEAEYVDDCFEDFDGLMHELEDVMDRRDQLLHMLELMDNEPVASALREHLGEDDEDFAEFGEFPEDDETAEGETPETGSLMDRLKQAMADGDEELTNELMARVQGHSQNG